MRCLPQSHRSPGLVTGLSGTGGAVLARSSKSGSARKSSISCCSKPVSSDRSRDPEVLRVQAPESSRSQSVSSWLRLSISRYALTCAGVRLSATWTGTCFRPSFFAASNLVCPQMTTPSLSTTIGYAPAKLFDRCGDLVNRALGNLAAVPGVGNRFVDRPQAHFRSFIRTPALRLDWDLSEGALCAGLANRSARNYRINQKCSGMF